MKHSEDIVKTSNGVVTFHNFDTDLWIIYRSTIKLTAEQMQKDVDDSKVSLLQKIRSFVNVEDSILETFDFEVNPGVITYEHESDQSGPEVGRVGRIVIDKEKPAH